MSWRTGDRKMDESVEGFMANPINHVVTVFRMQLTVAAKITYSDFKNILTPRCSTPVVISDAHPRPDVCCWNDFIQTVSAIYSALVCI